MSTEAERELQTSWAEEVRTAATWVSGPKKRKLLNLADRIDPGAESPLSPEEEAEQQAAERAELEAQAQKEAEEAAAVAAQAEADAAKTAKGH